MSSTNLLTIYDVAAGMLEQARKAQEALFNELALQGWERHPSHPDMLIHKVNQIALNKPEILYRLTNDSADPNYIGLVIHLLRSGWSVCSSDCHVENSKKGVRLSVAEALYDSITEASNNGNY